MNEQEKTTVSKMIRMFCNGKHKGKNTLCTHCLELENYAHNRLESCTFGEKKPVCKNCSIHCYKPEYRNRIREVMRYAGPRMILYHPWDVFGHLMSNFKK